MCCLGTMSLQLTSAARAEHVQWAVAVLGNENANKGHRLADTRTFFNII